MSIRIALVSASFDKEVVGSMIATVEALAAADSEVSLHVKVQVPGSYELPLAVQDIIGGVDAVVVLGYIERGETLHGEVMGYVVHGELIKLSMQTRKPVGIGIIGPGATREQALARRERVARQALSAVVAMSKLISR